MIAKIVCLLMPLQNEGMWSTCNFDLVEKFGGLWNFALGMSLPCLQDSVESFLVLSL